MLAFYWIKITKTESGGVIAASVNPDPAACFSQDTPEQLIARRPGFESLQVKHEGEITDVYQVEGESGVEHVGFAKNEKGIWQYKPTEEQ